MKTIPYTLVAGMLALCILSGCATTPESTPLSKGQLKGLFKGAKDPRSLWITVYKSAEGPVFSGSHRIHPNQTAELEFIGGRKSLTPTIPVQGRGSFVFPALIDTSCKESWCPYESYAAVGLIPLGPPAYESRPAHVADQTIGYLAALSTLKLGTLHVETTLVHVWAATGPMTDLCRQVKPEPLLVIGYHFLQSLRFFQFDYPNGIFRASSTLPYTPNEERLVATAPLKVINGLLMTEGMVDGVKGPVLLDSAGDFDLVLPGSGATSVKHLSLGGLVLRNVEVTPQEGLGLGDIPIPRAGRRLLGRFKVTVDNFQKVIYFERPEK